MLHVKFLKNHGEHEAGDVVKVSVEEAADLDDQLLVDVIHAPAKGAFEIVDELADLSVKELKAKAKELGLEGYSKLKADELREAIREAKAVVVEEVEEAAEGG